MKAIIIAGLMLGAVGGSALGADKTQCDSKPFTLKRPVPPPAKPAVEQAKRPASQPAKAAAPAKPKPKPIADCDKPTATPR